MPSQYLHYLNIYNTIIDGNFYDQKYAHIDGYHQHLLVKETYMYEARLVRNFSSVRRLFVRLARLQQVEQKAVGRQRNLGLEARPAL